MANTRFQLCSASIYQPEAQPSLPGMLKAPADISVPHLIPTEVGVCALGVVLQAGRAAGVPAARCAAAGVSGAVCARSPARYRAVFPGLLWRPARPVRRGAIPSPVTSFVDCRTLRVSISVVHKVCWVFLLHVPSWQMLCIIFRCSRSQQHAPVDVQRITLP